MRFLRKLLLLLVFLTSGRLAQAATYYLAANGNDAHTPAQAQNPATPWQSLTRLNAAMSLLRPGDQVLFRRGDTFRGQLVIAQSGSTGAPLTFGAYGPAGSAAPVLSGSTPLSGWTSAGPNLWEAPCPAGAAVSGLYTASGRALPLGRYPNLSAPNKGYLTIASHVGNTRLTAPQLSGNWTGATAVVRSIRWVLDRAPVTGHTGTTLTLGAFESTYYTRNGLPDRWGFFLQNHPATLDQSGEWYYYPTRATMRVYAVSAPANGALEATTSAPSGVIIRNQRYVTLENLTIAHSRIGLEGINMAHLVVRGVQVRGADENGILLDGTGNDVLLENNLIRAVNNNAVSVNGYTDFTFRQNTLQANGMVAGRGRSGDGTYYTCNVANSNRIVLENNKLDSCGYLGISYFSSSNITIARNIVSNFCLVKDDGGGIYTYNGGSAPLNNVNARIENNIVLNGRSAPEGTPDPNYLPAYGIYLDDCTRNVTAQGNTVAYCSSGGIFLHGTTNVTARGNTCFNNGAQLVMSGAGGCGNTGAVVQNNVLVSARPEAMVADYHVPPAQLPQLGTLSGNYYAQPFNDVLHIRYEYQNYLLSEWQTRFNQDAGSADGPVRYLTSRVQSFTGPERVGNGTFMANVNDWGYWASSNSRVINWDNTNALGSGGSLRLASAMPSSTGAMLTQTIIGGVVQGRSYVVRFKARSTAGPKLLEVYLNQLAPPYTDLTATPRRVVVLGPTAQTYEVALVPTSTNAGGIVTFQAAEDSRPVWLDNVTLREATTTPASMGDSIRFEYNGTAAPRTVSLPAGARYVDVRNVAYSSSLVLAPFTSVVLFRVRGGQPTANRPAAGTPVQLWPNPSRGSSALDLQALPTVVFTTTLSDALGRPLRQYALPGGQVHQVHLADLPAGLYLLKGQAVSGDASFALRLLKE